MFGRPVRDYRYPNSCTLDIGWPSPRLEACLSRAQDGDLHTQGECVWGFTQIGLSEEAQKTFTLVCGRGMLRPLVLFFGAKQGPSIFQKLMDSTFGKVRGDDGEDFMAIFMDDVNISTKGYPYDTEDMLFERHLRHCEISLTAALERKIQFKLMKSKFGHEYIDLLGFRIGKGEKFVDPGKADASDGQIRNASRIWSRSERM